jgi:hypothetical protein
MPVQASLRVEYANSISRWILGPHIDRQFLFALQPLPALIERFLQWYERSMLDIDLGNIEIDRPIFLIGLPRSGTTILQDILCTHPDLAYVTNVMNQFPTCFCATEDLRRRLGLDFKGERYLGDSLEIRPGSANEGLAILARWARLDLYSLEYRERGKDEFSPEQLEEGLKTLKRIVWCFGGGVHRLFNKNPGLTPYILLLKEAFPDCKIIHLIRDPRMCANSMIKLCRLTQAQELKIRANLHRTNGNRGQFVPYPRFPRLAEYVEKYGVDSLHTTAHLWNDAISFVDRNRDQAPFFYDVRYEDILANPKEEILKILDFCELRRIEDTRAQLWQEISKVGVIRHSNNYGDYEVIETICRSNMIKHGYL